MGRDIPPVQTGPGAQPVSRTMDTVSFPEVKHGRGVLLTTHPLLVLQSWKGRATPLPTLWVTTGPVTGTLYLYWITSVCQIKQLRESVTIRLAACALIGYPSRGKAALDDKALNSAGREEYYVGKMCVCVGVGGGGFIYAIVPSFAWNE